MSSHWAWVEKVMAEHDKNKPFAPENGQPLKFAVGDKVVFTNDYGVEFNRSVIGIYARPSTACGQYAHGARYYLDKGATWFPIKEASLRLANEDIIQELRFELRIAGHEFMKGDAISMEVMFWNLDARNITVPNANDQNQRTTRWDEYIKTLSAITKTELLIGEDLQLFNSAGDLICASKLGASLPR